MSYTCCHPMKSVFGAGIFKPCRSPAEAVPCSVHLCLSGWAPPPGILLWVSVIGTTKVSFLGNLVFHMDFLFPFHWFYPTPDHTKMGVFLLRLDSINSFCWLLPKIGNWEPFLLFLSLPFLSLCLISLSLVPRSSLCVITRPLWGLGSAGMVHIPRWCWCDSCPWLMPTFFPSVLHPGLGELLISQGWSQGWEQSRGCSMVSLKHFLGWV